jgi:soluble lytic murein transglycosylase-like protein
MPKSVIIALIILITFVSLVYPEEPKKGSERLYFETIIKASEKYDVEHTLIQAIIMAESTYNPKAVSRRGAKGLMQLMPSTAKSVGVKNAFNPVQNIDGGTQYFRKLLDRFGGNVRLALAAYNAGKANVLKYRGVPPFSVTKRYIRKVLKYQAYYERSERRCIL